MPDIRTVRFNLLQSDKKEKYKEEKSKFVYQPESFVRDVPKSVFLLEGNQKSFQILVSLRVLSDPL